MIFLPRLRRFIDFLLRETLILTSGIIKLELLAGTKTRSEYSRLKKRLSALDNIETDDILWEKACDVGFRLKRKGLMTIPYTDILIATCAMERSCILLHADKYFDLISEHLVFQSESYVDVVGMKTT